jgi:chromate reductase
MVNLTVLTVCGSLRNGSYNGMVQRALPSLAPEGMTLKPAPSFAEFPLYNFDIQSSTGFPAPVQVLADAIRAADGVIFCTPEYNFGIPGGLKNAIDWLSRLPNQPFAGKPIALQSASPGPVGGARVQYDFRKSMVFLDAFTLNKPEIFIGNCASKFDEKTGEITDEATRGFIKQQLAAFAVFIGRIAPKS